MSYVERILNNDPDLVDLRLTEIPEAYTSDMTQLIDALKKNTVIQFVRFDRDFLPGLKPDLAAELFNATGSLPALKETLIWHASLKMEVLTSFISQAKGLEHLQLGVLHLEGNESDFHEFSKALEGHPNLKEFELSDFSMDDEKINIDSLLNSLSGLPKLTKVKLEVTYQKRGSLVGSVAAAQKVKVDLSGSALASLIGSPSVAELYISRLALKTEDVRELAAAIPGSPALKTLALSHCNLNDDACSALAVAVHDSDKVQSLDLSCNDISDEGCIAIATALTGNNSVKFLRLWGNVKISNNGFDALAEMLNSNTVLERIPLMAPGEYKNRIDAKLVQNRTLGNSAA
mmetsp:Transcript_19741/g.25418  ORF Transcript_19741/g.25418 Transcript_19741/m.25418 type:complete len:346 (-) Transcript_19741:150-1187(-)|eukprot:CAMPEP_0198144550 /NCGR_PEP_ID=MMETSP1443-20131203/16426_1 /TAXON_ID=186043 /ORGANISM="Entomoneis sp., Strain CCMP2396" /LENGTH=345 /DNA_ID=CAMNT_0043807957 /DNA_START=131 /DNA_END=1168 /DNA_ORIENTATION=-